MQIYTFEGIAESVGKCDTRFLLCLTIIPNKRFGLDSSKPGPCKGNKTEGKGA